MKNEYSPYKAIHHIDSIRRRKPVLCYWLITSMCNYDCPVCINKLYEEFTPACELPLHITIDLARQLKDIGVKAISMSGGEPMLYEGFDNLLAECLMLGFDMGIISNGSMIDTVDINNLRRCKWVRFSINSMSDESFSAVHGTLPIDVRSRIEPYIKGIRSGGCIVGSSFLVQPENIHEMVDFVHWSKSAGFDTARFSYVREAVGIMDYNDEDLGAIQENLAMASELATDEFTVFGLSDRLQLSLKKNFSRCRMEDISFCLTAEGNVYRCCSLQHNALGNIGNIRENTLSHILTTKDNIDPRLCPVCWHSKKNEFMEYISDEEPRHVNFI